MIACIILVLILVLVFLSTVLVNSKDNFTQDEIPNVIYTYWGDDNIPDIVKNCMESWKKYNPKHKVIVLNKKNYKEYCDIKDIGALKHNDSIQRESDFIRLATLSKNGGFWIDASIVCCGPLPKANLKSFIGYYLEGFTNDPNFPVIENWFFACTKTCPFVNAWKDEFFSINSFNTVQDYINSVIDLGINLKGIQMLDYLCMHVAAQKVLQQNLKYKNDMKLLKAEDGPYKYLALNDWDVQKSFEWLCSNKLSSCPIIKFRGGERNFLQDNPQYQKCIFDN